MSAVDAAGVDELGTLPLPVELNGTTVALVRVGDEVFAIRDECSHGRVPLSEGDVDEKACAIECYLHGSNFDLRTGRAMNLPATAPVPVYPTQVVDGRILVDLDNPVDPDAAAAAANKEEN